MRILKVAGLALLAAAGALAMAGCGSGSMTNLTELMESRRLAADALVGFTQSVDAGNRAVMADTDEASTSFAKESEAAKAKVTKDVSALREALSGYGDAEELRVLTEFEARFKEYTSLDRTILDLAVQNTNLKAQRLSFGPAFEAADAFRAALQELKPADSSPQGLRVRVEVAQAIAAVREIQALQAPHIADADDVAMGRFEERAAGAEAIVRGRLETLGPLVVLETRGRLAQAGEALDRFLATNKQIYALSRQNSNVKSLALALGQKRTVAARCEESLMALQDALAKRTFAGTR